MTPSGESFGGSLSKVITASDKAASIELCEEGDIESPYSVSASFVRKPAKFSAFTPRAWIANARARSRSSTGVSGSSTQASRRSSRSSFFTDSLPRSSAARSWAVPSA
eukprot:CAMPEP_0182510866 /NCGR_PEP_ID=MMETSP1321-20130603/29486_1 /TAXON_ID=91990 /ORGANISM="Bolidomonas sp., Strain RCC1657" /LENGTH=107 /DNA_ID=CAMNT_0024717415 /DNA_START=42 /DNA_END=365 /DNA_ORIENTATION=+